MGRAGDSKAALPGLWDSEDVSPGIPTAFRIPRRAYGKSHYGVWISPGWVAAVPVEQPVRGKVSVLGYRPSEDRFDAGETVTTVRSRCVPRVSKLSRFAGGQFGPREVLSGEDLALLPWPVSGGGSLAVRHTSQASPDVDRTANGWVREFSFACWGAVPFRAEAGLLVVETIACLCRCGRSRRVWMALFASADSG